MAIVRRLDSGREKESKIEVELPKKPITPSSDMFDYCWCLFGAKGVGKTSLASMFVRKGKPPLIFQWEPGRRGLSIYQVPGRDEPPLDWPRYKAYVDKLCQQSASYPVAVIDTVDRCYLACLEHVCRECGVDHPNQARDYGATWYLVKQEFDRVQTRLLEAGLTVIYISHDRKTTVTTRTGEEYELIVPTCQGVAWEHLKAVCDFAFYYGYRRQKRILVCRGGEEIWSGCGTDIGTKGSARFMDPRTGLPLAWFPAGETAEQAWKNLQLAFENKLSGGETVRD
jgi:hypothetical protein